MDPEQIRRWARNLAAAEAREHQEEAVTPVDPEARFRAALDLADLVGELQGWPPPEDPLDRAEDERARADWNRLENMFRRS